MPPHESFPQLYLNENIAVQVVKHLSDFGLAAIHTLYVGNSGKSDIEQLEYATENESILVTHNRRDFRRLHNSWIRAGKSHFGIVIINCYESKIISEKLKRFMDNIYPHLERSFCKSASLM